MLKTYGFSIVFSIICIVLGLWWGHYSGLGYVTALWLLVVLGVLEISLSFDNAVVNAHGAHYAIGLLACIMFLGTQVHVPEVFTGLLGVAFIVAAYCSSIRHRKAQQP